MRIFIASNKSYDKFGQIPLTKETKKLLFKTYCGDFLTYFYVILRKITLVYQYLRKIT